MPEFIRFVLIAAGLIAVAFLVIGEAVTWLDRRSHRRAQRIERELAKTQKRLAAVRQAQAALLNAHAHEAAVALILASYRVSNEPSESPADQRRCQ